MRAALVRGLLALAALLVASAALAQTYPARPITVVVPFPPGASNDALARITRDSLSEILGQPIVIENRAGAAGSTGAASVANAAPDGYTLLLHHIGMATSPALYRNLPYKTLEDFEYVGLINEVPMTLVGRPTLPASNFAELRKWLEEFSKPMPQWDDPFVDGAVLPRKHFAAYTGTKSRDAPANLRPVGTGPYRIVDFRPGDLVRGELNPAYHMPHRPHTSTPSRSRAAAMPCRRHARCYRPASTTRNARASRSASQPPTRCSMPAAGCAAAMASAARTDSA
jgi:hypothetical protein